MKRVLWAVGPLLWLVGCVLPDEQAFLDERSRTCGVAFSCPEGSSCVRGFCVPGGDGGDTTLFSFMVTVPPADVGGVSGGTTYEDPFLPGAWRRDQVLPVEVRINGSTRDPSSLVAVLRSEGSFGSEVSVLPFPQGQPCDAGFCGGGRVEAVGASVPHLPRVHDRRGARAWRGGGRGRCVGLRERDALEVAA